MAISGRFVAARGLAVRGLAARGLAVLALAASALLLAGCAGPALESPLSQKTRALIRTSILDQKWSELTKDYPEALRPAVLVVHTLVDHDWPSAIVKCLRDSGFTATATDNGYRYSSSFGQSPLEFAVAGYVCSASYPVESEVKSYLTDSQKEALYNYQRNWLRPCLLAAGAPTAAPPDRQSADSVAGLAGWSPYQVLWQSGISPGALGYFEHRCPPLPTWLDLAG